jgi:outer membrane protein assembly factor BamB
MSAKLKRAASAFAFMLPVGLASAATMQRPLPANSLERNGTPQPMQAHEHKGTPPAALPDKGPFKYAAQGLNRQYPGTPVDVLTYHYDLNRTGWNPTETVLTPANVNPTDFGLLTTLNVDGNVMGQPLLVSNFTLPDGSTHNVLIVTTGHNSVYAFDADNYALLWQVSLGQSQSSTDVGCGDVLPEYGISSTPVIVRSGNNSASIYIVAASEPAPFSFHTQLHELDLGTGKDARAPVEIAPQAKLKDGSTLSFDPQHQWNRAGLAFKNGNLYVAITSHCDLVPNAISGWLLDYNATTLKLTSHFHTIETPESYELGSVWMSGFAPAIDQSGNVFIATGNGAFDNGVRNWGQSLLKLTPDLKKVEDYFTPASYVQMNARDQDFGSGGIVLLPVVQGQTAPPMATLIGKSALLYLFNQNKLGHEKADDRGALQWLQLGSKGAWGGPAYYGSPNGGMVYAQIDSSDLFGFNLSTGPKPALTQVAQGTSPAGYGGSQPIVSSNGSTPGTGVVWLVRRGATLQLEAYDALALGTPLFAANAGTWVNTKGNAFLTPLEANGRVYVPSAGAVTVFGLGQ